VWQELLSKMPNRNRPSHYKWVEGLVAMVAHCKAPSVSDLATKDVGHPLFIVMGACPSVFAGMQAVVYTAMEAAGPGAHRVDYWWVKPDPAAPANLQMETLNRHAKGPFKNDPGRSKAVYAPLAKLFEAGLDTQAPPRKAVCIGAPVLSPQRPLVSQAAAGGLLRFGLERGAAGATPRAVIECEKTRARYFVCMVWQEDWTTNLLARSRFIKGQLVYQRELGDQTFYARPYSIVDDTISVPHGAQHEVCVDGALPFDACKLGAAVLKPAEPLEPMMASAFQPQ
jgi:hypothetical protein